MDATGAMTMDRDEENEQAEAKLRERYASIPSFHPTVVRIDYKGGYRKELRKAGGPAILSEIGELLKLAKKHGVSFAQIYEAAIVAYGPLAINREIAKRTN
jgi:hypothetical protein